MSDDERTESDEEPTDAFDDLDAAVEDPFESVDAGVDDRFSGVDTGVEEFLDGVDADARSSSDAFDDLDGDDPAGTLFERMSVDSVDGDLWDALDEVGGPEVGGATATTAEGANGRTDHVVDKREYCQRCPNFSDPPEVACELDDVDVVSVVNADEFRVRGCPMVSEDGPQFDTS